MQRIIVIAFVLIIASLTDSFAQKQRRADKTNSGRAAYGVATVSNGRMGRVKKVRREKAMKRKARAVKGKPAFRKKQAWAG